MGEAEDLGNAVGVDQVLGGDHRTHEVELASLGGSRPGEIATVSDLSRSMRLRVPRCANGSSAGSRPVDRTLIKPSSYPRFATTVIAITSERATSAPAALNSFNGPRVFRT